MPGNFKIDKWAKTALILFFSTLFIFSRVRAAVVINEVMYGDKDSTKDEFIELYNTGSSPIALDKYKLTKKTASGNESNLVSNLKFVGTIAGKGYFVIAPVDYKNSINADLAYSGSSYSIAADNSVLLYDASGKLIDVVGYGKATFFEKLAAPEFEEGQSIGRIDGKDTDDNSQDFTVQDPTPGKENKKTEEITPELPKIYSDKIEINELYPYPNVGEEEFIELYNSGSIDQDLFGYTLHDASKTGEYDFKDHQIIHANNFLVLYGKKDFSFALNNSGDENVTLRDGNGVIVSSVSYDGAKIGVSYDYDGNAWHWSKFLTPGSANIFEDVPDGDVDLPDDVFVNVYADFSVSGLAKNTKTTWNFGDGHKSYLTSTKHKYEKEGKYSASVTYARGSENETKNFIVDVQEIPHPKLKIVTINANPKGADTGVESLTIQNKTRKKVNLNGWSIATCWKKCINHPIREDFRIKGKKSKDIKSDVSSFTLNNTKSKIQLRYPDGKVAQRVKYKKKTGTIADGEIYQKVKGGWVWVQTENHESGIMNQDVVKNATDGTWNTVSAVQKTIIKTQDTNNNQETKDDNQTADFAAPAQEKIEIKKENKFDDINNENVKIEFLKNISPMFGAENLREVDGQYLFTPDTQQEHYAITFLKNITCQFNEKLNYFFNYFFN